MHPDAITYLFVCLFVFRENMISLWYPANKVSGKRGHINIDPWDKGPGTRGQGAQLGLIC